jgi:formylmethanofuran dehydrogenase subunit E
MTSSNKGHYGKCPSCGETHVWLTRYGKEDKLLCPECIDKMYDANPGFTLAIKKY